MPEEVPEEIVRSLGMEPGVWFTTSAIAKRTRKLANPELGKYNVDVDTSKVEEIGEVLLKAGLIERKEIEITRNKMMDILGAAILKHGRLDHKLYAGIKQAIDMDSVPSLNKTQVDFIVQRQMEQLVSGDLRSLDMIKGEIEDLQVDFKVPPMASTDLKTVRLVFYKLKDSAKVPNVKRTEEGKLILEGISQKDYSWVQIAKLCELHTEDALYEEHKKAKRRHFEERTDYFLRAIDQMAKEGLGVYLHPTYYDESGVLRPERVNSFYVLFGFEKLKDKCYQAAELVSKCEELGKPLLKFTPGEVFLPVDDREPGDSYIRAVTLDMPDKMDGVLGIIRQVATYLAGGEFIPYKPGSKN